MDHGALGGRDDSFFFKKIEFFDLLKLFLQNRLETFIHGRYDILGFGLKTGFGIDGLGLEPAGLAVLGSRAGGVTGSDVGVVGSCFSGIGGKGYFLRIGLIRLSF